MSEKKKRILQIILIIFVLLFIAFVICMQSPLNPFAKVPITGVDSSVFKYIGWRMYNYEIPYKDIFDHKGPIIYFINYLGVFISYDRGVWFIEYLFMFASLFLTYKIFCKFCGKASSLIATLLTFVPLYSYFEGGNLTEEYALPFIILGLYIFIDFFKDTKKYIDSNNKFINWKIVLNGISFGCTFLLRQNMIALWVVFCIAIIIYCIKNKLYKELCKFIASFLIGVLIITIPIIIYLIVNGAFVDFIKDYFLFNFTYSSVSQTERVALIFVFLLNDFIILLFIIMIIKLIYNISKKKPIFFETSYLVYMIINLIFTCISGRFYFHYGITLIPAYIYPLCVLFNIIESVNLKKKKICILTYIFLVFIIPTWLKYLKNAYLEIANIQEISESGTYVNDELIQYIKENTHQNEEIAIYGNYNLLYNHTRTPSASKYSYIPDKLLKDDNFINDYLRELEEKKPKLIIWIKPEEIKNDKMKEFLDKNNYNLCNQYDKIDVYCLIEEMN